MQRTLRRVVLAVAATTCTLGTMAVAAQARPASAAGASAERGTRSLSYVQPLDEQETGTARFLYPCVPLYTGEITGTPVTGQFIAVLVGTCTGPGSCNPASGVLEMDDRFGQIQKEESGLVCLVNNDPTEFTFEGTYEIVGGSGRYAGAEGNGTVSKRFSCPGPNFCSMSGTETSGQEEEPGKTGGEPEHVLLCSPTLVQRADGTLGIALQIPWADYQAWLADATTHPEIPAGSIPSKYGQDIGLTCDNLPGYVDSGKKADEQGVVPSDQTGPLEGAIYPYWIKA